MNDDLRARLRSYFTWRGTASPRSILLLLIIVIVTGAPLGALAAVI